jgi:hypothetical protein
VEKKSSRKCVSELRVTTSEAVAVSAADVRAKSSSSEIKRSKAKRTSKKKAAKPAPKRVRNYKFHAKKELSAAFPAIVNELVSRAKKGSLTHTRLLFDIGGVKDKPVHRESQQAPFSLAQVLLDEVAKQHEQALEPLKTGSSVSEQQTIEDERV